MKKYEYKFVNVPKKSGFKVKSGDTFDECKNIILEEAEKGWRLKQVVMPLDEKAGVYRTTCYEIIFEREAEQN